jgi:hypothetical protein
MNARRKRCSRAAVLFSLQLHRHRQRPTADYCRSKSSAWASRRKGKPLWDTLVWPGRQGTARVILSVVKRIPPVTTLSRVMRACSLHTLNRSPDKPLSVRPAFAELAHAGATKGVPYRRIPGCVGQPLCTLLSYNQTESDGNLNDMFRMSVLMCFNR